MPLNIRARATAAGNRIRAARAAATSTDALTTLGELAGGAVFAHGAWDYSHPAGELVAGALLVLFSWLAAR